MAIAAAIAIGMPPTSATLLLIRMQETGCRARHGHFT
jgi:hypothetical protein